MDQLQNRMREVLLQLSLLSNGRTSSFEASRSSDPDYTPTLSPGDAPQLYYARRWDAAVDDIERAAVLKAAQDCLEEERHSQSLSTGGETLAQRNARIVAQGEGWEARDVANHFKCGINDVWKARDAAGRDRDRGERPRELGDTDRRAEIERMAGRGMSARQIAFTLGVGYNTVRRDLGRNA